MKTLKFKTYIDKAVVEEETKSGRDGDECLLYFILDNISHDLFDVGTSFGVETVAQLRGGCIGQDRDCETKSHDQNHTEASHVMDKIERNCCI